MSVDNIKRKLNNTPIFREFKIDREADVDEGSRSVSIAFAADKPVEQWFGRLQLSLDKKHIRTERLDGGGMALLMDHNTRDQVGVVDAWNVTGGVARATVRFGKGERASEIFQDIQDGIRKNVSVGFMIYDLQLVESKDGEGDLYRCEDWEPYEISIVSVPADISVGVGREKTFGVKSMNITNSADVVAFGEIFNEGDLARQMVLENPETTRDDVRAAIQAKRKAIPAATVPVLDAHAAAERQGVVLARSPRYGGKLPFKGENAEERAYRFGSWVSASLLGNETSRSFCSANGIPLGRAMSEGHNEKGGYLVPEEFGADLIDLIEEFGAFRANAKVVPMASDTRSDPIILGEFESEFVGESEDIADQDIDVSRVSLIAKKHAVYTPMSSELYEDSLIDLGGQFATMAARAFALKEDKCGFIADGTSTYGGMVGIAENLKGLDGTVGNIAGLQVASGNAYSEIDIADFLGVAGRLPEYADAGAKWFVSKSFYYNVMVREALAAGGVTAKEVEDARNRTFLGYPVVFTQVMPKAEADSQVCAILGDLTLGARLGDRRQYTMAISEHVRFKQDDLVFKATARFDVNSAFGVGNASATASARVAGPIVGLITAGS